MSDTIATLLQNSGLPGPRGNLGLMYSFARNATEAEIEECLSFYHANLENSPEEFVAMCGIVASCIRERNHLASLIAEIRSYASHRSWRIREAVAIGIQEIAANDMPEIMDQLEKWLEGNDLEKRAVVAALCEPKLLQEKPAVLRVLGILDRITRGFEKAGPKLSEQQKTLRKTLAYGWSVAVAALPEEGKAAFAAISGNENKHIRWIVRENLKKNRLRVMDQEWVEKMLATVGQIG